MAKGFAQVEGLDFGETFTPVARLEAIRILLAYASHHNMKLFQMDVKSVFLMALLMSWCLLNNFPGLRTLNILIMFIGCTRLSTGSSKRLGFGMV